MPELAGIGLGAAFLAGLVSFLSPCILPLVPGYVSFAAGQQLDGSNDATAGMGRAAALRGTLLFVGGFSMVFIALGASASAIGGLLQSYRYEAGLAAGAVVMVFGLHMTGLLRLPRLNRSWHPHLAFRAGHPLAAFGLGSAFAFGWTPCVGPILASILGVAASRLGVGEGSILLAVYSLGLAVPFLLTALLLNRLVGRLSRFRRAGVVLHRFMGAILMAVGLAMATGYLNTVGTWMLKEFPVLQNVVL